MTYIIHVSIEAAFLEELATKKREKLLELAAREREALAAREREREEALRKQRELARKEARERLQAKLKESKPPPSPPSPSPEPAGMFLVDFLNLVEFITLLHCTKLYM